MKTFTNPVWNRDFPDPHVLAYRGKFYAYATETGWSGKGFQCMESPDLVNWTHKGPVFTPIWSKEHLWAPEVIFHNKKFWMTYSARNLTTRKHDIGIAVADTPLGPFTDKGMIISGENNKVGVIDTNIHIEPNGDAYLLYSEESPRSIVLRRLAPDFLSTIGETVTLVKPDQPWERNVTEAPTLLRRDGKYHLIYSAGWYQSNKNDACYCVCHAVADTLMGAYTKTGSILATLPGSVYGPGHQSVVSTKGEDWLLYHAWDDTNEPRYGSNKNGRTLRLDRLYFKEGIPQPIAPTTTPQPTPKI